VTTRRRADIGTVSDVVICVGGTVSIEMINRLAITPPDL
jgi:hypothetical protein